MLFFSLTIWQNNCRWTSCISQAGGATPSLCAMISFKICPPAWQQLSPADNGCFLISTALRWFSPSLLKEQPRSAPIIALGGRQFRRFETSTARISSRRATLLSMCEFTSTTKSTSGARCVIVENGNARQLIEANLDEAGFDYFNGCVLILLNVQIDSEHHRAFAPICTRPSPPLS